jgi:hypothetical protein
MIPQLGKNRANFNCQIIDSWINKSVKILTLASLSHTGFAIFRTGFASLYWYQKELASPAFTSIKKEGDFRPPKL